MQHPLLSAETGLDIHVKHENHNLTGAFKVRGGLNLIAALSDDERARGVITASTGNHGQSIAFASRRAGVPCIVAVPGEIIRTKTPQCARSAPRWSNTGRISTRRGNGSSTKPRSGAFATCIPQMSRR